MGKVYLVGAGPGRFDLITLKGFELIKKCDAIIYDNLISNELLEYVPNDAEKIYVGKRAGTHSFKQEKINQIIVEMAKKHKVVVRLKGGDPFVFGRGGEEIDYLNNYDIPFDVVPGVTSAVAVPEISGIPVTHREVSRSFHVITGHTKDGKYICDFEKIAKLEGTLVFLMGLGALEKISSELQKSGMDGNTPAAVISNGGLANHSVVRASLSNIYEESIKKNAQTPAIIVVGETAKFDYTYKNTKTVGIVSSRGLYEKIDSNLQDFGFETKWLCNMKTKRNESEIWKLSDELDKINQYEWIVFTSQNAMKIFFDEVKNKNIDFRSFHNIKFGVIGSGSNRYLRKYGFSADFIPSIYNIDSFSKEFVELLNNDKKSDLKIMILHAVRGNDAITKSLDENSISYKDFKIYDVVGEKYYDSLDGIDMLAFLSASGVEYFYKDEGNYLDDEVQKIPVACIGDSTARELEKYGKRADVVSGRMDVYGLSNAIADFHNKQ